MLPSISRDGVPLKGLARQEGVQELSRRRLRSEEQSGSRRVHGAAFLFTSGAKRCLKPAGQRSGTHPASQKSEAMKQRCRRLTRRQRRWKRSDGASRYAALTHTH